MKTSIRPFVVSSAMAVVLYASGQAAFAQTPSQRPFRAVFGGGPAATPDHTFDLSLNLVEAYDDNLLAEGGGLNQSAPAIGGLYSMFGAEGAYEWRGRRSQFGATGATVTRYYNESKSFSASGAAGIGFSTELARRTTLSANQTFAYSPSYLIGLFPSVTTPSPGASPSVGADYAVADDSSYQYGTSVSISRGLTRRGTLSGSVDYRFTDFVEEGAGRRTDQANTQARIQFSRGMSRNTSLRVGYRYRTGDLGSNIVGSVAGEKSTEHGFDVGVDYVRPLSATRRLVFAFGLGSSAADLPGSTVEGVPGGRQYRALGDASFGYQFRRTWETRASYRRGLEYIPELAEPVYTDGFSAAVNGMLTPRMDFSAGAGYSAGESAAFRSASAFDTYTATVRIRRAITNTWSAYGEYVYYFYDFGSTQLQPGVPSSMERNGVRAGITIWLPVIRR